jgi:hypothetical protein
MANGTQINKPVMKYFFKRRYRWCGTALIAGASCRTTLTGRHTRIGSAFFLRLGWLAATLEIGCIPAGAFELKAWCRKLLGEVLGVARRARGVHRITDLVHDILLKAAVGAAISVDRH